MPGRVGPINYINEDIQPDSSEAAHFEFRSALHVCCSARL